MELHTTTRSDYVVIRTSLSLFQCISITKYDGWTELDQQDK